jgi:hypothetical protein
MNFDPNANFFLTFIFILVSDSCLSVPGLTYLEKAKG